MTEPARKRVFHIGSPRTSQFKPDGTLNTAEPVGNEFDEVLDPLNDLLTGRNRSGSATRNGPTGDGDPIQNARDRQRLERQVHQLQEDIRGILSDMLAPQRIIVEGVTSDSAYNFNVYMINRGDGYRFNARMSYETMEKQPDVVALCRHVAERVLAQRARVFAS